MTTLLLLAALSACPIADANGDNQVSIAEVIRVVNAALDGCDPPDRFQLDSVVVRDRSTGLVWEARGCAEERLTYAQAEARAADFTRRRVAGKRDWRVPSVAEWLTIEDGASPAEGFNSGTCPCEPPDCNQTLSWGYWSSDASESGVGRVVVVPVDWETSGEGVSEQWEVRLVAGP